MTNQIPTSSPDTRLEAHGDLVASTVEQERSALLSRVETLTGPVIFDLSRVKEIDSLGITLVLGLFKSCQKLGLPFSVEGVSPEIMRVFRLFSLPKVFPVKEG